MSGEMLTVDELEQRVVSDERLIARIRARQLRDLAALDTAQVATGDGCRSLSEWVAARLDVSLETARSLVRTMRRIQNRVELGRPNTKTTNTRRVQRPRRMPSSEP